MVLAPMQPPTHERDKLEEITFEFCTGKLTNTDRFDDIVIKSQQGKQQVMKSKAPNRSTLDLRRSLRGVVEADGGHVTESVLEGEAGEGECQ